MKYDDVSDKRDNIGNLIDLFKMSHTGLWKMDPDNSVIFYNAYFYEQFDIPDTQVSLEDWIRLIHPDDRDGFRMNISKHRQSSQTNFVSEYRVMNKKGDYVWIEAKGIRRFEDNHMIGTHRDITGQKEYEIKLYNQAYIDKLTNLPNANKLIIDIEQDISDDIEGTLLFLDLSHLNHMLTVYGQGFIDRLILEVTRIVKNTFSEVFDIYRFIPFVFSFKTNRQVSHHQVKDMCQKMEMTLSKTYSDFDLSSEVIYKAVMMTFPQEEYFQTCEDMFNRFFLTFEQMDDHEVSFQVYTRETKDQIHRKMFIETNLIKALEDEELYPVFQPIVSINEGRLLGFEALCRWNNPQLGAVYPDEFIPTAERSGAIIRLGERMLDMACSFIRDYNQEHQTDLAVSVNASVVELRNMRYFDYIRLMLKKYQLKPSHLIIEITESLMLDENGLILDQLEMLKNEGIGIAIDDFGTGYSSVNTMFSIPTTEVKIDREVMLKVSSQPIVFDFIKSVVDLCHKYGIIVVAEGIEDQAMIEKSQLLMMNYLQGYYFSKPLSEELAMKYTFE